MTKTPPFSQQFTHSSELGTRAKLLKTVAGESQAKQMYSLAISVVALQVPQNAVLSRDRANRGGSLHTLQTLVNMPGSTVSQVEQWTCTRVPRGTVMC